ncbi:ferritin-like domain-containing protein [Sandaracinus amylolyticus]|uniref:Putative lipoprotein n=1 Tax=Sandaracinus amylolyticus TaxID=927083 RepID=A0A0F6VZ31_9BACT|nr:ferritin-like domain-containing protein [Sandaracinus amylolyticus]AKF03115.1 putative lipoprotein [Sandaracinus amylolyticus]
MRPSPSLIELVTAHRAPVTRMLRAIAGASIAATLGGCAESHFSHPDFASSPSCGSMSWRPLGAIETPAPHAHLALVSNTLLERIASVVDETGTRCGDATDATTCTEAFDAATIPTSEGSRHVISTDGDQVEAWTGRARFVELLGTIDTSDEALMVVWSEGFEVRCGTVSRSAVREVEGGFEVIATKEVRSCNPIVTRRFVLFVNDAGEIEEITSEEIERIEGACAGRRPEGLEPARGDRGRGALGRYLAEIARLEASAVIAFDVMERELRALAAPEALLRAVREARADEVRHAEVTSALARARGGNVEAPVVAPRALRDARAIALENAVEGCVRETFGAIVGLHQAACAEDLELRNAMRVIAEDELRHADVSWRLAAWLEPRLDDAARAEVDRARAAALDELRTEVAIDPAPGLARAAGLPSARVAAGIVDRIARAIG